MYSYNNYKKPCSNHYFEQRVNLFLAKRIFRIFENNIIHMDLKQTQFLDLVNIEKIVLFNLDFQARTKNCSIFGFSIAFDLFKLL